MFNKLREIRRNWTVIRPQLGPIVRKALRDNFNRTQFLIGIIFGIAGYALGHALGWAWFQ